MSAESIVIIEDDSAIRSILSITLKGAGFPIVKEAESGDEGLRLVRELKPSIVLLDLMLPGIDGFTVCKKIRESPETASIPVIMLTARSEEEDIVRGLECGADDYITKPFSVRELMARVKANIRRSKVSETAPAPAAAAPANDSVMALAENLTLHTDSFQVYKNGNPIDLTQREYDLICFLAAEPGKIFSREVLMEHVWNYDGYVGDVRAVDVAVRRLREKLEDDPANPVFIVTKRGMGYYFGE